MCVRPQSLRPLPDRQRSLVAVYANVRRGRAGVQCPYWTDAGRPSEAQVPAGHGRATSLVERGIGGGFGSRLLLLQSGGFSPQGDRGPRSAPRTVPGLSPPAELALTAAGSIPERQAAAPRHWLRNRYDVVLAPFLIGRAGLSVKWRSLSTRFEHTRALTPPAEVTFSLPVPTK